MSEGHDDPLPTPLPSGTYLSSPDLVTGSADVVGDWPRQPANSTGMVALGRPGMGKRSATAGQTAGRGALSEPGSQGYGWNVPPVPPEIYRLIYGPGALPERPAPRTSVRRQGPA